MHEVLKNFNLHRLRNKFNFRAGEFGKISSYCLQLFDKLIISFSHAVRICMKISSSEAD